MATKSLMVRPILDAIKTTLSAPTAGIYDQQHDPLTFFPVQNVPDVKTLIRAVQRFPVAYLRCLRAEKGSRDVIGVAVMRYQIAVDVFLLDGDDLEGNLNCWDILDRMLVVVGQEVAKPGGSDGNGGLFGYAAAGRTAFDRIEYVYPEGPQHVETIPPTATDTSNGLQHGYYEFGVEVKRDISQS